MKSLAVIRATRKPFIIVGYDHADYIANGTTDNVPIQAAIDAVNTLGGGTVFLKKGTYNVTTLMTIGSNTILMGEEAKTTIIKKTNSQNNTIFNNKDSTNGNSFIQLRNLTIDQNGANQSSGGGCSFTGLTDSIFDNVIWEKSYVFNLFIGSLAGTSLTGTLTFTNNDTTVTGSSTLFTSELAVGDIVKSNGGHFQRVASITSNTALELDRVWGWATESGVTAKKVPANARNRILNCRFNGTVGSSDNVGLGLFDDSLIQGCISRDSTGYGFGPDHANRLKFIGNTCFDNTNSGVGLETCGYCVVTNNEMYRNGNGIYLLSGAYRNIVSNNQCYKNTFGIQIVYNSTSFPKPNENQILGNVCDLNTTHGIRVGGGARTSVLDNRCFNNGDSGIATATDNSLVPDLTLIQGNQCYDNQDTKTQVRGIYIAGGSNTMIVDNMSLTADHVTAGVADSGTNTTIINTDGTTNSAGRTNLGITASTYSPTRSAETNLDANVTPSEAQYMRVGNTVTVSGNVTINPTLTTTATSWELSLPVTSNIGAVEDLAGTFACGAIAGMSGAVSGSVANNTAVFSFISSDVNSNVVYYQYSYQVI